MIYKQKEIKLCGLFILCIVTTEKHGLGAKDLEYMPAKMMHIEHVNATGSFQITPTSQER